MNERGTSRNISPGRYIYTYLVPGSYILHKVYTYISEGIVVSKLCDLLLLGYLGTGRSPGSQVPAYQPTLGRVQGGVTTPPGGGRRGAAPPR